MIHCFKLCGYNIVLDVASGSIHTVDDLAYDVIRLYELVIDGKDISVLTARVSALHPDVSEDEILEVVTDIEGLRSRGKLFSPDGFASVVKAECNAPLSALCLNVSHVCNMSCEYCFAGCCEDRQGDGSSVSSGAIQAGMTQCVTDKTDEPSPCLLMSLETAKAAVDFLVAESAERQNLDIDFFGGEPLLNRQVIKDVVAYAREIERSKAGKKFRFTLTTNALLIDDDVINFTNNQMHNVVLSLDGRPRVHDAMRKLPAGDGSYSAVVENIRKLVDARRGKGYYIRGTFTRHNTDFVNDILHISNLGYKEISMEPVISKPGDSFGFMPDDLETLCEQYETLAVEMLRLEKLGTGFNFYHFNLDLLEGPCVHKRVAGCGVGTEYMAVTPSGELYPCHQFVGDRKFLLGDVWRGVVNNTLRNQFAGCSIYSRPECRECWARFYCSGGCAANAYNASGSINGIYEFGCELFKKRMECAIMMKVANEAGALRSSR